MAFSATEAQFSSKYIIISFIARPLQASVKVSTLDRASATSNQEAGSSDTGETPRALLPTCTGERNSARLGGRSYERPSHGSAPGLRPDPTLGHNRLKFSTLHVTFFGPRATAKLDLTDSPAHL